MPRSFADVTAVEPRPDGTFDTQIDPAWTIGGKPNGGYLLALLGRAAVATSQQDDVLIATGTYLSSPAPGPAVVEVEVLRAGRSVDQVRARLLQDDRPCLEGMFTLGRLDPQAPVHHQVGFPDPAGPGPTDGHLLPAMMPNGTPVAIMNEVELRLDSMHVFTTGPSGVGRLSAWLHLPVEQSFDALSLVYALDALPPATFDIAPTGWVPTLSLTTYIRSVPAPGPVRVIQDARLIADGRVDETCHVWDVTGKLVAHGTQLAGIRLA